jgi:hypothetical protein
MNDIWKFELTMGHSPDPRNGACVVDATSWFHSGTLDDHPQCVCPVLAAFCRPINDGLNDQDRQKLKAFIPRLAGSHDPEAMKARAEFIRREYEWRYTSFMTPLSRHVIKREGQQYEALAASIAISLLVAYVKIGMPALREQDGKLRCLLGRQHVADDICLILDGALNLGKQGELDPVAMEHANRTFGTLRELSNPFEAIERLA